MGLLGGLLTGGAGLIGGAISAKLQAREAQRNRDFQERMFRNRHTIATDDLKRAGLNPILSATGGAAGAAPSGSMASPKIDLGDAAAKAFVAKKNSAEIENIKAGTNATNAKAALDVKHGEQVDRQGVGTSLANAVASLGFARSAVEAGVFHSNAKHFAAAQKAEVLPVA